MKLYLVFALLLSTIRLSAQDMPQVRRDIEKLTSPELYGRGYVHQGDRKAADYIRDRFREIGLAPVEGRYFQPFVMDVNTITSTELQLNDKVLRPGLDYIVQPNSGSGKVKVSGLNISKKDILNEPQVIGRLQMAGLQREKELDPENALLIIDQDSSLMSSVASSERALPSVEVLPQHFPETLHSVKLKVKNRLKSLYVSNNVLGLLPGTAYPDAFIIISAHYDHLGGYDKNDVYFPGANDNASGVSMLLQLATYFSKKENRLPFSLLFVAFGGEEAGLLGSKYFVSNPPVSLNDISFVLNLDIISTGDKGVTVVNGSVYKSRFALLDSINTRENLLPRIGSRGRVANSDHYFFSEMGVPSFFIYTEGSGRTYYHDVRDKADTLPLSKFEEVYRLLTLFIPSLMKY